MLLGVELHGKTNDALAEDTIFYGVLMGDLKE